ncbi:hypothetical protein GHK47_02675 [Sinorhizobium meliloti]|uniref:glycoside hydrolase family 19 protein n=1 Tax=Rhizobium meliloti TaxID=382 RepID=UPI001296B40C|nr:glycoside hydrolase family 19 protein [Sinorhizobium meliloti]MQV32024.1 hypothetical protein [Sinorhizobium meliloti]
MFRIMYFSFFAYVSIASVGSAQDTALERALTIRNVSTFSPRARADIVAALVESRSMLSAAGINTPRRFYFFMSQISLETGGFVRLDENLSYRAERLRVIFRKYVKTDEEARRLERKPVQIANLVYGDRLGNRGRHTNDGWLYRGSGYIQLTGRGNFTEAGKKIGMPLVDNPDWVRSPKIGLEAAVSYWTARSINAAADTGEMLKVRRAVNGGTIGLAEARVWYARARRAFGPSMEGILESAEFISETDDEELEAIADTLREHGYYKEAGLESAQDFSALNEAIRSLQRAEGLPETTEGNSILESANNVQVPEDVFYNLLDPQNLVAEREASEN